jgi:hypothetical protein
MVMAFVAVVVALVVVIVVILALVHGLGRFRLELVVGGIGRTQRFAFQARIAPIKLTILGWKIRFQAAD